MAKIRDTHTHTPHTHTRTTHRRGVGMRSKSYAVGLQMPLHHRLQLLHGHGRFAVRGEYLVAVADGFGIVDEHVDNGGALLAQRTHALQQLAAMRGIVDADGVQIDFANLLAYLQLIVAVLQKTLAVLRQADGAQPLADDVVVRHVRVSRGGRGGGNVQRGERDFGQSWLVGAGAGAGDAAAARQWLQMVAAAGGAAAAAGRCLHSSAVQAARRQRESGSEREREREMYQK